MMLHEAPEIFKKLGRTIMLAGSERTAASTCR